MPREFAMRTIWFTLAVSTLAVSCTVPNAALNPSVSSAPSSTSWLDDQPINPVPPYVAGEAKVALGRSLFHDKRLSGDNTLSCASCHDLGKGGTDQAVHSTGIGGAAGGINAPSVLNSGLNFVQFWNGRSPSLEDQVNGPTHNPKEMGSNWDQIVGKLSQDPACVDQFRKVYGDGPKPEHIRDAIATFERTLNTVNAPFDRFLKGDSSAIDAEQKHGYQLFKSYGCVSCHQGTNVGGNMYQKFGLMGDYFKDRGAPTDADDGRMAVTHKEEDRHVFRVPSLRNVDLTAPYFHDGSATTLPQAVEVMAKYQLGRPIPPDDLRAIVRFLQALTGDQPRSGA